MSDRQSSEAEDLRPFIDSDKHGSGLDEEANICKHRQKRMFLDRLKAHCQPLWTGLPWILVCILTGFILVSRWKTTSSGASVNAVGQLLYTPAQKAIEYEVKKFKLGLGDDTTEYQGDPSPELDDRWTALYEMGINLIPMEMASRLPNKTIIYPHDKQRRYMIELDVFHQLHCLNTIRKALHPEYYHPHNPTGNAEDEDGILGAKHVDHCVDAIRQSLMCNADLSVLTWKWDEKQKKHFERGGILHTCKRFDKIQEWARGYAATAKMDNTYREMNDPLDPETWEPGYDGTSAP